MINQYPKTQDYFYSLFEKNFSTEFENLTDSQKQEALEYFLSEADEEATDALNSGEAYISQQLANHLIQLNETNWLETKELMMQHLWENARYYIKEIFETARSQYEDDLAREEEPDYEDIPDYIERLYAPPIQKNSSVQDMMDFFYP